MSKKNLPVDEVSEYVGVEPKDHTTIQPSLEGLKHKPDTKEDLYQDASDEASSIFSIVFHEVQNKL